MIPAIENPKRGPREHVYNQREAMCNVSVDRGRRLTSKSGLHYSQGTSSQESGKRGYCETFQT